MHIAQTTDPVPYNVKHTPASAKESRIIAQALEILSRRVHTGPIISSPQDMKVNLS